MARKRKPFPQDPARQKNGRSPGPTKIWVPPFLRSWENECTCDTTWDPVLDTYYKAGCRLHGNEPGA